MVDDPSRPTSWLRSGLDMLDSAYGWGRAVPQVLGQAILPGWTFAINNVNSSAPQTEAAVVAQNSYGRQLGRISDVLALLLHDRDDIRTDGRVVDFLAMKAEIDETKTRAAGDRLDQIRADLLTLRTGDRTRYDSLRAALLSALNQTS
jgi:hypothetical protein